MTGKITRINPGLLHATPGYHHITIVESGRMAFLAGQCPLDATGTVVGIDDATAQIDLAVQVDQVAANALVALTAAGTTPELVVRSVIYVASGDNAVLSAVWRQLTDSVIGAAFTTASTLLGVAQLGFRGQLVELDLTAALPD